LKEGVLPAQDEFARVLLVFSGKVSPMSYSAHPVALSAMFLLLTASASAQEAKLPETKVVLRMTREFLNELTGKQYQSEDEIKTRISGADVAAQGTIECTFDVKLHPSQTECAFDLVVKGTFITQITATRRPVLANLHGAAPFHGTRRIVFDGAGFTGQEIDLQATHHSDLDQVSSSRRGLIGAITRSAARKSINRSLPASDRQISEQVRTHLTKTLKDESDQRMTALNQTVKMIVKEAEELLREEKLVAANSLHRYFAATEHHLCMSIGPARHRIPALPALEPAKRAAIELWIAKGDDVGSVLDSWELVKPAVFQRVARRWPALAKMLEEVRVESVEGWYVATLAPDGL
jgi:hypothetical protein